MFLHIGESVMLQEKRIIGIFDLDNTSQSKITMQYLKHAEEESVVINACDDIPRSFVVCDHPYHEQIVYISHLSPATLLKRAAADIAAGGLLGESGKEFPIL